VLDVFKEKASTLRISSTASKKVNWEYVFFTMRRACGRHAAAIGQAQKHFFS